MAGGVEEKDEVIDIHLLQTLLYHVDCLEMDWIFLCVDLIMTFLTFGLARQPRSVFISLREPF